MILSLLTLGVMVDCHRYRVGNINITKFNNTFNSYKQYEFFEKQIDSQFSKDHYSMKLSVVKKLLHTYIL